MPEEFSYWSDTYRKVIDHRGNCQKWKTQRFCLDCFGGGLTKFTKDYFKELKGKKEVAIIKIENAKLKKENHIPNLARKALVEEIDRVEAENTRLRKSQRKLAESKVTCMTSNIMVRQNLFFGGNLKFYNTKEKAIQSIIKESEKE